MYDQLSPGLFLAQEQSVRLQARSRGDGGDALIMLLFHRTVEPESEKAAAAAAGRKGAPASRSPDEQGGK